MIKNQDEMCQDLNWRIKRSNPACGGTPLAFPGLRCGSISLPIGIGIHYREFHSLPTNVYTISE